MKAAANTGGASLRARAPGLGGAGGPALRAAEAGETGLESMPEAANWPPARAGGSWAVRRDTEGAAPPGATVFNAQGRMHGRAETGGAGMRERAEALARTL